MAFQITPKSLKKVCEDMKLYPHVPALNEIMYLHHKGITKLENLEEYTGLRTLYLESNAIDTIEGLEKLVELRCLYLGQNMISHISGLDYLKFLENLDLSQNDIRTVDNLSCLPKLRTLNLSGNKIRSRADVEHLTMCPSLTSLDLASNKIDDAEAVEVLKPLSNLSLVRLVGNPVVSEIKHYRKTLLAAMPYLKYLDESPVFDKDLIRQEESETRERNRRNFEAMVAKAKEKALTEPSPPHDPMRFRAVPPGESDSEDDSDLPPSCRVSRKGLGLKGKPAHQGAGNNDAAEAEEDEDDLPELEGMEVVEEPAANIGPLDDDEMIDAVDTEQLGTGNADTASEGSSEDFVMVQQPVTAAEEAAVSNEVTMGDHALEDGPPVPPPPPPASLRQDLLAELRKRVPASPSHGTSTPNGFEGNGHEESQRIKQKGRRGRGEALAKRGPSVWGTDKYRQLWQMACEVGEQQERDQQLEEEKGEAEDWLHVNEGSLSLDGRDQDDGPDDEEHKGEEPLPVAAAHEVHHNVAADQAVAAEDVQVEFSIADAEDSDGEPPEAEPVSPDKEQLEVDSDDEEEDDAMAEDDEDAELFERYCVTSVAGAPHVKAAACGATIAKETEQMAVSPCQEAETAIAAASEDCAIASTASAPDGTENSGDVEDTANDAQEDVDEQDVADDSNQLHIGSSFLDELD